MTLFSTIAAVSGRVAQTPSRLAKVREIAECLRALEAAEVPLASAFLSGETVQGKLGVSYAALRAASATVHAVHIAKHLDDFGYERRRSLHSPGNAGRFALRHE